MMYMLGDAHLDRVSLLAALGTSEQAALSAEWKKDHAGNGLRPGINYKTIEPDFVGTEVEHTALLNALKGHAPEVNEAFPVQELRTIRDNLLAIPVE